MKESYWNVDCDLAEPPGAIASIHTLVSNGSSASVSWSAPSYDGHSPLLRYRAQLKRAAESWASNAVRTELVEPSRTAFQFDDLRPATVYEVRVQAENAVSDALGSGQQPSSASKTFTTLEEGCFMSHCYLLQPWPITPEPLVPHMCVLFMFISNVLTTDNEQLRPTRHAELIACPARLIQF